MKMNEITIPPSPNWYFGDILSCNNDGVFVYGSRNDLIVCRHMSGGSLADGPQVQMIRVAHKEKVTVVRLSKTNGGKYPHSVATVGDDSIVKLWHLETLSLLQAHNFHESSKVVDMDWSIADPNLVVSVDENNNIICWNLNTNSTQRLTLFKLRAMCLACCPHKADTIAVGSRTGLVFVIKNKDGGQVLYRMRGHDSEVVSIAWCPVSYNIFKQSKTEQLLSRDMLLASAGKDRDVYIWRAGTDGQCQTKFNLPVTPVATMESSDHYRSGGSNAPSLGMFRMCLRWPDPSTLLTSTAWGEVLKWRLTATGEDTAHKGSQKPVKDKLSKNYQLLHNVHLRGLFSIACTPAIVQDETANFWTRSTDSEPNVPLLKCLVD
uniref:Gem-associated protein 5 first beta-propeller domain-containing protein n=1 Tax=Timema bartmani TaxID=61472 RepID=A0A7R9F619_9NEOP|nr:unnamed protein product [Timema bartmani]